MAQDDSITRLGTPSTCRIEGCSDRHKAWGLCGKHWARWRALNYPAVFEGYEPKELFSNPNKKVHRKTLGKCLVSTCKELGTTRNLCVGHYSRWIKYGKPNPIEPFLAEMAIPKPDRVQFIPPERDRRMKRWHDGLMEAACIDCGKVIPIDEFATFYSKSYTGLKIAYKRKRCVPCEKSRITASQRAFKPRKDPTPCAMCDGETGSPLRKYCPACRKKADHRSMRRGIRSYSSKVHQWKRMLIAQRGGKCERCGFAHPAGPVYDLHHKDPATKEKNLSLVGSWEEYQAEANKCLLLCANCHRIVHWEDRQAKAAKPTVRKPAANGQIRLFSDSE